MISNIKDTLAVSLLMIASLSFVEMPLRDRIAELFARATNS